MFKHLFAAFLALTLAFPAFAQPETQMEAPVAPLPAPVPKTRICGVQLSPDGKLLVASVDIPQWHAQRGSYMQTGSRLCAWDIASGQLKWEVEGKSYKVRSLRISPDGTTLIEESNQLRVDETGYHFENAHVILRNTTTGEQLRALKLEAKEMVYRVEFSPDGKLVIASVFIPAEPPVVILKAWEVATGNLVYRNDKETLPYYMAFPADGKYLLTNHVVGKMSRLVFWPLPGFEPTRSLPLDSALFTTMALSADGKALAGAYKDTVSGQDIDVSVWNLESGGIVCRFQPEEEEFLLNDLTFSPDGKNVIGSGAFTKQPKANQDPAAKPETYTALWFWNSQTGVIQRTLEEKKPHIMPVGLMFQAKFTPDGKNFVAIDENKVELRSLEDGHVVRKFEVGGS